VELERENEMNHKHAQTRVLKVFFYVFGVGLTLLIVVAILASGG
jgi:hypothetical protein